MLKKNNAFIMLNIWRELLAPLLYQREKEREEALLDPGFFFFGVFFAEDEDSKSRLK
jgi:hypothetical protein